MGVDVIVLCSVKYLLGRGMKVALDLEQRFSCATCIAGRIPIRAIQRSLVSISFYPVCGLRQL